MRYLNAAPPTDPLYELVASKLLAMADEVTEGEDQQASVLRGLATVGRILGRSWDSVTEQCRLRLVELEPERWQEHFDLGLFYKTRGRFKEGMIANQCAATLGGQQDDPVLWNTGICATGSRDCETAIHTWKRLGLDAVVGRFALPEAELAQVKVRLAERPLAERGGDQPDDPGREETIWVERLSPCHGVIRSALFQDLGVDYGDVVLFDGAPITHHKVGEADVPVFPHLVTLHRSDYRVYRFAGTQRAAGQIAGLSGKLPADGVVYVHSEQLVNLCTACWEDGGSDHAHAPSDQHVAIGKICVPPDTDPSVLLALLDECVEQTEGLRLFVPSLSQEAGDERRANMESRRVNRMASVGIADP